MKRCGICDYTAELGSPLLNKSPSSTNTVRWNNKYQGYLCLECTRSIEDTLIDQKINCLLPNESNS
jgi:hypothetical protein